MVGEQIDERLHSFFVLGDGHAVLGRWIRCPRDEYQLGHNVTDRKDKRTGSGDEELRDDGCMCHLRIGASGR